MKRILIAGCIIASLAACGNGSNGNNSGDSTNNKDSSYNPSSSTDTGQGIGPGATTDTSRNTPKTSEDTTRR
jgi:hypothetical protein